MGGRAGDTGRYSNQFYREMKLKEGKFISIKRVRNGYTVSVEEREFFKSPTYVFKDKEDVLKLVSKLI